MAEELIWAFDEATDVLYMSVGEPDPRARSCSDDHGFVWRMSRDGLRRGVMIQNARAWLRRKDQLEKLLAEGFRVKLAEVRRKLPEPA